jgi:cell pole-organizing protein PopZ
MTTMNGAKHDVEDILASIRTSIADRSPMFDRSPLYESEKREVRITTLRGRSAIADEAAEFELPAIFKAPAQPTTERPNLLGRLSEALASSGQERERSRTVIPFEPAHGRMIEPPPVTVAPVKENSSALADKIAAENDGAKRNMPTFFDTRLNRMGEMSRPVAEPPQEVVARPVAELPQPPRLPDLPATSDAGGVEDAAAQLLRPILKQWLTENMPRIVEKALMNEAGGDGRGGFSRR